MRCERIINGGMKISITKWNPILPWKTIGITVINLLPQVNEEKQKFIPI